LLLLLITHTPHSLLLLIVCTHTRTSCYCWFCTQKLIDWVCALFVVDCETLLMIVFPKKKEQNLLLCMWSRFYSYCTYPDSLASYYIYIYVCVCIATYLILVIGACRTLTFKVLLDNHESMQNNELYDEWKSCLVQNVLSIIVSMNNSLARGDKIPEFYYLNFNFKNENLGIFFHHGSCELPKIIFCCKFLPICNKQFCKRNILSQVPCFSKNNLPKKNNNKLFFGLQHEKMLKISQLS
jgi:hypothetical protein